MINRTRGGAAVLRRLLIPQAMIATAILMSLVLVLQGLQWLSMRETRGNDTRLQQATGTPGPDLNGRFVGGVRIVGAMRGDFRAVAEALPTALPTPWELAMLNTGFQLRNEGSAVTGSVDLDFSMVHSPSGRYATVTPGGPIPGPRTPASAPVPLGPSVDGEFDGVRLALTSELMTDVLAPSRTLTTTGGVQQVRAVTVTRQIYLYTTETIGNGDSLAGDYYETVWRYGMEPMTLFGRFAVGRPSSGGVTPGTPGTPATALPTSTRRPTTAATATRATTIPPGPGTPSATVPPTAVDSTPVATSTPGGQASPTGATVVGVVYLPIAYKRVGIR